MFTKNEKRLARLGYCYSKKEFRKGQNVCIRDLSSYDRSDLQFDESAFIAHCKKFYLIDEESEEYFVGQVMRHPKEIKKDLNALEIGQVLMTSETRGFERVS